MILSPLVRQRFFDSNGVPLAGGQLFSYIAGTTTPQGTFSNLAGTTNTNPVILDAYGYADIWIDSTKAYKFVLEDANSSVLWSVDNINGVPTNGGIITTNSLPISTLVPVGTTLFWPNLTIPSGLTLTVNGLYYSGYGPVTVAGILQVNSGGVVHIN